MFLLTARSILIGRNHFYYQHFLMRNSLENTTAPDDVFFDAEVPEIFEDHSEDTGAQAAAFDRFMSDSAESLLNGVKKMTEAHHQKTSVEQFSWFFKSRYRK